ncbi:MAG: hypothetical protein IT479_02265 [Xanthomonadales bacterium]|nr:hypothetical protein [Xanthomonadales bacterium]MCC6592074.1 hypothetical protein [Xanthomonadales bacterium]MCE7931771.1 hypothetical protein [Xanthomonadales bacterium PRO6]
MNKIMLWVGLGAGLLAQPVLAAPGGYAEGVYADYAAASTQALNFELKTLRVGSTEALRGSTMMELTGAPRYALVTEETGLKLDGARFAPVNLEEIYLDDLDMRAEDFEKAGFPLASGQYRLLEVRATLGKATQTHTAAEFCWSEQGHCVVFDPNIDFLDSVVNNLRERRASGWAPRFELEPVAGIDSLTGSAVKARHCGLADFPNSTAASITWGAYTVWYKSLVGLKVVEKRIGSIRAGVRCDASCRPQPYGYANASSAWAVYPNSVQCDFAHNQGTSGSSAKYVGKSGCAHRFVLGAKFNATAKGVGLGVDVQIDATGGVDQNGGAYRTACAWFN